MTEAGTVATAPPIAPAPPASPSATPPDSAQPGGAPAPAKADAKPTEGSPSKVVPEKYDLKLPQDSLLDATHLETTSTFAKEKGLSQEEAQAILERDNAIVASYVDKQRQQVEIKKEEWAKSAQIDKEYGGDGFSKNAELARRVVDRFGSQALKTALNESGLGNHPELVRLLVRIGKSMASDSLVVAPSVSGDTRSTAEILYPSMDKKE